MSMKYTKQEVIQFIEEADVKFIRLAFCDIYGKQKNIAIMPEELPRAFHHGIAIDAWSIDGFEYSSTSDLLLHPDPSTLAILPWRPEHGRVVRMFCNITWPDRTPFECDTRKILENAISKAQACGCSFKFGAEMQFYLFNRDDNGNPTRLPYDYAGYMDIAPDDRGENIRREVCLTLEQMGIFPESSHHEAGPGQNEIDFRYSDPLSAADNAVTFASVVKTIANRNGISADFGPKPLKDCPGNDMHINLSISSPQEGELLPYAMAGILKNIKALTLFLNPLPESYERLRGHRAPGYITWSKANRSQLIRIPASSDDQLRAELRSPDPMANPYIAYALLIYACLDGIHRKLELPPATDINMYTADTKMLRGYDTLPDTLEEAKRIAANSDFIREYLPQSLISGYCKE